MENYFRNFQHIFTNYKVIKKLIDINLNAFRGIILITPHNSEGGPFLLTLKFTHLHQRRFRRIYLSTNPSPQDPQNLLLAQTNRPMETPGRIFSIIPSCQSDKM